MKLFKTIHGKAKLAAAVCTAMGVFAATPMISMAGIYPTIVTFTSNVNEHGDFTGYTADGSLTCGNIYQDQMNDALAANGIDLFSSEEDGLILDTLEGNWLLTDITADDFTSMVIASYEGKDAAMLQTAAQIIMNTPKLPATELYSYYTN